MKTASTAALILLGASCALRAQSPVIPNFQSAASLGNTVVIDTWTNLSKDAHPTYPGISGSQIWPSSLASDVASSRQALFRKQTGADADTTDFLSVNPFGGGIYSSDSTTRFEITSGVLANLETLQLQISLEGSISGVTLTLTTTTGTITGLLPDSSTLLDETMLNIPGFGVNPVDLNAYQWDLSAYAGTITNVSVDWSVSAHSITYGEQLAQASQSTVPEPGSTLLLTLGGSLATLRFRTRIRRIAPSQALEQSSRA